MGGGGNVAMGVGVWCILAIHIAIVCVQQMNMLHKHCLDYVGSCKQIPLKF